MWTAILTACLISAPSSCREHTMLIQAAMPVAAFVEAQSLAAVWVQEHPGMRVKELRLVAGRGV